MSKHWTQVWQPTIGKHALIESGECVAVVSHRFSKDNHLDQFQITLKSGEHVWVDRKDLTEPPFQRFWDQYKGEAISWMISFEGKTIEQAESEFAWMNSFYNQLHNLTNLRHCRKNGHRFHDDSYGNSESGAIVGHCKRCGWTFKNILY